MNYHVAKNGFDTNPGTKEAPFLTINKAAAVAWPGDVVIVHQGIYREWVNPAHPGTETAPIVYQAAQGEKVVITGSEAVSGWENINDVWTVSVPNSVFGPRHPYQEEVWGDWKFDFGPVKKVTHTGGVYLNGCMLREAPSIEAVRTAQELTWYSEVDTDCTTFYCNFQGTDPNEALTEYVARPNVFWPEKTNMDYITVRGFELRHGATNWAPPTALQEGLIGPHWSKGWVIEGNIIHDTMCIGISLGKDVTSGHNEWNRLNTKEGTQRERESIFRALHRDWDKRYIGSHTVRSNVIYNCEQAGIVGHLGCAFSTIEHNHIYNINMGNVINGAETAGIKLHAAIDVVLKNNYIHHCCQGIWLDWQDQGARITGNVFWDNRDQDVFVEISHGPCLVDHNVILSPGGITNACQGTAFVHNLIAGHTSLTTDNQRHTPYHFPHETAVFGLATVPGGDDRFFNNIFVRMEDSNGPEDDKPVEISVNAIEMDGAPQFPKTIYPTGLSCYNGYPAMGEEPKMIMGPFGLMRAGTAGMGEPEKLPCDMADNVYYHRATHWDKEKNYRSGDMMGITFKTNSSGVTLCYEDTCLLTSGCEKIINTEILGISYQTESKWTDPDNAPYTFDRDMLENQRKEHPTAGPIELDALENGRITLKY